MNNAMSLTRNTFDRVWRSKFARSVAVVASGTAGAQAITIAFSPLITRIYGPEAFGLLGTFNAIVSAAIPVAALAYPIAIVLPRSDDEALSLAQLSGLLAVGISFLTAIGLWFAGDELVGILGVEAIADYLLLIPLAMLFAATMQIARQWLIRKKEFGVVARAALGHSLILNSAKTGFGLLHPVGIVLITLATLGHVLHAALMFIGAWKRHEPSQDALLQNAPKSIKELAHQHRDFPFYRAPQNFINAASQSLPILMLAAFFGSAAAGFYTLAKMVMALPTTVIGNAVKDVFYPRITKASHKGENLTLYIIQATGGMFAIGVLPFGVVMLFGPWLFGIVFGDEWVTAGEYARWLSFWLLTSFSNRPSVATIPVLGIQKGFLAYEIASVIARVSAIIMGVLMFNSDLVAIILFATVGAGLNIFLIGWVLKTAHRRETG